LLFWNNRSITLDRNSILRQIEAIEKLRDVQRRGNFTGLTIQANLDFHKRRMLAQLTLSLWERHHSSRSTIEYTDHGEPQLAGCPQQENELIRFVRLQSCVFVCPSQLADTSEPTRSQVSSAEAVRREVYRARGFPEMTMGKSGKLVVSPI
jgi:hypothetical protein